MIIDVIYVVLLIVAIWKGYRKGLIIAVFSVIALMAGLAAAIKLSAITADKLNQSMNISGRWLPFLSFIIVMVAVIFLVRWAAILIEKGMELALMGWANKLGGILLFVLLYTTILSVFLFYGKELNILKPETIAGSSFYSFIEPWGPKAINGIGTVIPIFKDMFMQLQNFFGNLAK